MKEPRMYRKILVGYDGHDSGRDALALAASLRAPHGVVIAACVYPVTGHATNETLLADAASQTVATAHAQADGGDWLELRAAPGYSPAQGLHVLSEEVESDLVIVGSSGSAERGRVRAGRTGERLLNGSPCPVAVAPRGFAANAGSPRVIGVAYDGSESAEIALQEAIALSAEFDAALKVITVVPPFQNPWSATAFAAPGGENILEQRRNGFRQMLEEAAARAPAEARAATVLRDGNPADVIADEAEKGIHLLVLGSRNYGPIRRVMVGSTAIELMRLAPCPVLVLPRGVSAPSAATAEFGATTTA
jgi:nucleotide-binding universal stress UspA family protein